MLRAPSRRVWKQSSTPTAAGPASWRIAICRNWERAAAGIGKSVFSFQCSVFSQHRTRSNENGTLKTELKTDMARFLALDWDRTTFHILAADVSKQGVQI